MAENKLPFPPEEGQPVWLRFTAAGLEQSNGFFPSTWFSDAVEQSNDLLIRIDPLDIPFCNADALDDLVAKASQSSTFTFMVRRWIGKTNSAAVGPAVESFACSMCMVREFITSPNKLGAEIPYVDSVIPALLDISAYDLSRFLLDHTQLPATMRCIQLPYETDTVSNPKCDMPLQWIAVLKPESFDHMRSVGLLQAVIQQDDSVSIGLDGIQETVQSSLLEEYAAIDFYAAEGSLIDPYLWMDKLWQLSDAEHIFFHDLDGALCADARQRLLSDLVSRNLDIVACHEIHIDEVREKVLAVRFPSELTQASAIPVCRQAINVLPSLMRKTTLTATGGFSSNSTPAKDTEFLCRAVQQELRMGNVDDYLFIRRRRYDIQPATETVAAASARIETIRTWARDYDRWHRGELAEDAVSFSLKRREDYDRISIRRLSAT